MKQWLRVGLIGLLLVGFGVASMGIGYQTGQRLLRTVFHTIVPTTMTTKIAEVEVDPRPAPAPVPQPDYQIPKISNGLAPVLSTIPTKEPVVFLGIDDGANRQQFELDLMKQNNVKASLFLANRFMSTDPGFFKPFVTAGSVIEDHSVTHRLLSGVPYADQKQEICGEADIQQKQFGKRPVLFRPPGGSYDETTQRAAADCGMKAVVLWIAKANGGSMQYQVGHGLRPGDIVLMHFRPEFKSDMTAFLAAQNKAGLHTELLEDWLAQ